MAEMREAKGFKPGESASEFNKRRMALNVAKKQQVQLELVK